MNIKIWHQLSPTQSPIFSSILEMLLYNYIKVLENTFLYISDAVWNIDQTSNRLFLNKIFKLL